MQHTNKVPWQAAEIELLKSNKTAREIAAATGRTIVAVKSKRRNHPHASVTAQAFSGSYTADSEQFSQDHYKTEYAKLAAKYKKALTENSLVAQLAENVLSIAPKSYDAAPKIITPKSKLDAGKAQSAVLLFSDTHVGQVIKKSQTLGFGEYDFPIFLARLKVLEDRVTSILRGHVNTAVPELVIAMLGDMIHGNLDHSAEAAQVNTLFTQFYGAGHAIAQFLRNIAATIPKIRIFTVVGNHPRWSDQRRPPTENRYSNLDNFLYAYIAALTRDIPNVEWNITQQPFSIFRVQDFVFYAAHGDGWRGGDKALGIPNHAIGRNLSVTTQLFNKHGSTAPHYYLAGHLHRDIEIPHATGSVVINGGFPGLDGYGLSENFNPVDPTQRLFLVHPHYGKTASYQIALKFAAVDKNTPPYSIPGEFLVI